MSLASWLIIGIKPARLARIQNQPAHHRPHPKPAHPPTISNMPSPYATQEDPSSLWYEQVWLASTHIGAMAFGILLSIYCLVMYHSLKQKKIVWGWVIFNSAMVIGGTINIALYIRFNQSAWIDERNYPGGPSAFLVKEQDRPIVTAGNIAALVCSELAEGLLLYRAFVVWRKYWYIIILPGLFFLACTALYIVTLIQLALPTSPPWSTMPNFGFPVWLMVMVMNMVLTFLIASRLLYMRHQVRASMGEQYGKAYTSIAAMMVESALPLCILCTVLLVLFWIQDPAQNLVIPLLVQVECISPMLIILRVMQGRAWKPEAAAPPVLSVLKFKAGEQGTTTGLTASQSMFGTEESENTLKNRELHGGFKDSETVIHIV